MAFSAGTLQRVDTANSDGGTLWMYKEAETLANVRASGYFNNAVDYGMAAGDVVMLFCSDGFGFSQIAVSGSTYSVGEGLTSA